MIIYLDLSPDGGARLEVALTAALGRDAVGWVDRTHSAATVREGAGKGLAILGTCGPVRLLAGAPGISLVALAVADPIERTAAAFARWGADPAHPNHHVAYSFDLWEAASERVPELVAASVHLTRASRPEPGRRASVIHPLLAQRGLIGFADTPATLRDALAERLGVPSKALPADLFTPPPTLLSPSERNGLEALTAADRALHAQLKSMARGRPLLRLGAADADAGER